MDSVENSCENSKFAGTQIAPIKCYLCDKNFMVGDDSYLIFEKRFTEKYEEDAAMATVLSSAIGKEIAESTAHSKVFCHSCNELVLQYELIEQRYFELKYRLIRDYNKIASKYGTELVPFEICEDVEEITESIVEGNADLIETNVKQELTPLDKHDIFEYLMDKNFTITPKLEAKDEINHLNNSSKFNLMKNDHQFVVQSDPLNCENAQLNISKPQINDEEVQDLNFDVIDEEKDFVAEEIGLDAEENSNSLHFIADDNNSFKSIEDENTEMELEKSKPQNSDDLHSSFLFDGEFFFCLLCPEVDVENSLYAFDCKTIKTHLREKHDLTFFVCYFCGTGFTLKTDLMDHIEISKCGSENVDYGCDICFKKFNSLLYYQIHKKTHSKSFDCHVCSKQFSSKKHLEEHLHVHAGSRPFKCSICTKDFTSKYTLNSHIKIHFERQRSYVCTKCNKSFLTAANLQQHSRTHSNAKDFTCDVCQKSFAAQHNLDVHKIIHTGHKPFLCRTCGKSFARRAEITDHERTHTGERPFECDLCGMKFAQRSNLSTHKNSTHFNVKKHKCDSCSKSFKRRRLLDYHIQAAHTGERPYKCEICHSTFVYPEHFKKHLRIHSGVKPFSCEVCGKNFNSRDNRNAHRFIHSDKKPYECLTCGQGFMRKPLLYNHMQSVGHINDTIIVNQPRIKQVQESQDTDDTMVQIDQDNYEMIMDSRVMLMDEEEDIDGMILKEEHLIDSVDDADSMNNTLDDNTVSEEALDDDVYSINKYFKKNA